MKIFHFLAKMLLTATILISLSSCKDDLKTKIAPTNLNNSIEQKQENQFCIEYNGKRPSSTIGYQEVATMLKQYDNTRAPVLKKALGKSDTKQTWFEIEELKRVIAYYEALSKEKNIQLTGINVMSVAYPDTPNYDKTKRNMQTVLFVPTTTINGDSKVSFDPLHSKDKSPVSFIDLLTPYMKELSKQSGDTNKYIINMSPSIILQDDMNSPAANRGIPNP